MATSLSAGLANIQLSQESIQRVAEDLVDELIE